ncbi:MAG: amino acid transporter [Gemmatimonadetes bacterium]|nr:amino acid transporter [Gemmatimonadota bacterium]NNF14114.1 amino acid transporter [Gemmatimonadota bacterium]
MPATPEDPWSGLTPADLPSLLDEVRIEWWVGGGWALDLWVGRETRGHGDLDVGCRLCDVVAFVRSLDGWESYRAEGGRISPLPRPLASPPRGIWLRRSGRDAWDIQLMPEEEEAGRWRYRRDRTIERPFSEVIWRHESGLLALRPEVQLLYKAKDIRPQDQADFDLVLPTLDAAATDWLAEALRKTAPSCLWLDRLPPLAADGLGAD